MAIKFHSGPIYLGNGEFAKELFVSDFGTVITESDYKHSTSQFELDLEGKLLLPAFRDGHAHPLFAGREARGVDISSCQNDEELIQTLRSYAIANPEIKWIDGAVFDRSLDMTFNRSTLDSAVPGLPVVLHGDDHHTLWVNSKALEAAGLLTELPQLESGSIDVDEHGVPTGILREWPAMSLVMSQAPKITQQEDIEALLWADQALASNGIVECVDAWIDRGMAETYLAAHRTGRLQLDYTLCFRADPITFTTDIEYFIQMREELKQTQGQVVGSSIKFFADGVFGSATALVTEPYLSTQEHGEATWPEAEFRAVIELAHRHNFQIHIHAIGDQAISMSLDILEALGDFTLPPVIAHAELVNEALIKRMANLGVIACVQPYWAQNNGLLLSCEHHLGKPRLESLYAFKDMFEAGVGTVFSSDWPISTFNPIKGLAVAVNRREISNQVQHNLSQAVTVEQAISAYSANTKLMLASDDAGTLTIGQPFDALILNQNIFQVEKAELIQTKVLRTYKAGKELFSTNP